MVERWIVVDGLFGCWLERPKQRKMGGQRDRWTDGWIDYLFFEIVECTVVLEDG